MAARKAPARGLLLDTSAWIEAMRRDGDPAMRAEVATALRENRARLCDLVLLELWNGVRGGAERRWLSTLEETVETVATSPEVWSLARQMAQGLRTRGLTLPATDLLIAACARAHGLDLLHRDAHFQKLAEALPEEPEHPRRPR